MKSTGKTLAEKRAAHAAWKRAYNALHPRPAGSRHAQYLRSNKGFRCAAAKALRSLLEAVETRKAERRAAALKSNEWLTQATRGLIDLRKKVVRAAYDPKAYYAANREKFVDYNARAHHARKAAKLGLEHPLTTKEWKEIKASFNHACAYCLATGVKLSMDHVIALARGGKHEASNVVPACMPCNQRKWARAVFVMVNQAPAGA